MFYAEKGVQSVIGLLAVRITQMPKHPVLQLIPSYHTFNFHKASKMKSFGPAIVYCRGSQLKSQNLFCSATDFPCNLLYVTGSLPQIC